MKVTYMCRGAKTKTKGTHFALFYFILFLFLYLFLLLFFLIDFFIAFLAFRNKGSSKTRQKLVNWAHHKKCGFFFLRFFVFSPSVVLLDFFYRVFWAFRNQGSSKMRWENRGNFSAAAKKSTHLRHISFLTPPLAVQQNTTTSRPPKKYVLALGVFCFFFL
jgi:hypothetical protein